ncbi:hypothetical protein OIDMADRAFT_133813 [Oidiodendron maius Zn]|uniref:Major royal jelly protein n=1 Tax=Oidiodendron maius (strain Zn) TaxID=913774 RepID=A0A0C3GX34_OIDMZ|nr:hypothetical protein OIDMADRAFT_133813 [Oidiodendron maius Zn]
MRSSLIKIIAIAFASPQGAIGSATFDTGLTLTSPSTGISTTPDGRLFVLYSRGLDGSSGPQLVEWKGNSSVPYPDEEWNSYAQGKDPATHFIRVNSQRVGPDGALWIVDPGANFGSPVLLPDGPKVVKIDLETDSVARIYPMGNVTESASALDDIRFNAAPDKAYLTDVETPGLIVLDLFTGEAQRVLDNHISTTGYMPISAEGTLVPDTYAAADQLEVSPDNQWLYYQPSSGGMWRIETRYLDEAFYNSSLRNDLGSYVNPFASTSTSGGTAIDANGTIYVSDTDRFAIYTIAPNGTRSVLVQDPRLSWIDAMWIDSTGRLWMPSSQFNRAAFLNNGTSRFSEPFHVYVMDLDVRPSPIDHA